MNILFVILYIIFISLITFWFVKLSNYFKYSKQYRKLQFEKITILFEFLTLFAKNPDSTFLQLNSQIESILDKLEKNSDDIDSFQNKYCRELKK